VTEDTVVEVAPRTGGRITWKLEAELAQGTKLDPPARRDPEGTGVLVNGERLDCTTSHERPILGVALDIGTTTLAGYLMDLETGVQEAALSMWNPQAAYGADVISRIDFSEQRDGGLKLLQDTVIEGLNQTIGGLLSQAGREASDVYHISVAGNPTMLHLFLGREPGSIARAPYHPQFKERQMVEAASLGLEVCPAAIVETLPMVSGYIGADTMAMALFLRLDKRTEVCLAIDVGTNGEILLAKGGEVYACSTAAGPAFEGARISRGMRAEPGAIDSVSLDSGDGLVRVHTIGDAEPRGLSGSGLVSAIAALLNEGLVEHTGRFMAIDSVPANWASLFRGERMQREFVLSSDGAEGSEDGVALS